MHSADVCPKHQMHELTGPLTITTSTNRIVATPSPAGQAKITWITCKRAVAIRYNGCNIVRQIPTKCSAQHLSQNTLHKAVITIKTSYVHQIDQQSMRGQSMRGQSMRGQRCMWGRRITYWLDKRSTSCILELAYLGCCKAAQRQFASHKRHLCRYLCHSRLHSMVPW